MWKELLCLALMLGCMVHNLFDEYRFFPKYPEKVGLKTEYDEPVTNVSLLRDMLC